MLDYQKNNLKKEFESVSLKSVFALEICPIQIYTFYENLKISYLLTSARLGGLRKVKALRVKI